MARERKAYEAMIADRPEKFSAEDVSYRDAEGKEHCSNCIHFYQRRLDHFGVCEIMRSEETDADGVDPDYVCDYWNQGDDRFPLLK